MSTINPDELAGAQAGARLIEDKHIPEDRVQIAREATYAITVLSTLIRDASAPAEGTDYDHEIFLREIGSRIIELNNVVMSVLDNDDDTANLYRKVLRTTMPASKKEPVAA